MGIIKNLKWLKISYLNVFLLIILGAYLIKSYFNIQNYEIIAAKRLKHLFVIENYIYKNSSIYDGRDAIITLFNGERLKYNNRRLYCQRQLSSGRNEIVIGNVLELVYGPRQCMLTMFRLFCPFSNSNVGEETIKYEIGTRNLFQNEMEFQEFSLTKPNTQKRSFVSCMSRMIAFDDWALLLVALETFKFYGGDLVVAYVECALKKVVDLMKLYEMEGLIQIKHAYRGAEIPNIPYDPDSQTEYANQMTNSHLCLYEFKESAEFIAFTDWDDILIGPRFFGQRHPPQNYGTFIEVFRHLSSTHPFAGAFSISRLPTFVQNAFRPTKLNSFSIFKTFNRLGYSNLSLDPKMIVRPQFVAGVWIHKLKVSEWWRYHQISVNESTAVLLHLKNLILDFNETETFPNDPFYQNNGSYFVNGNLIQKNMENMFEKYNFSFDPSTYPHSKLFHKLIFQCYIRMEKNAQEDSITFCPNYKACIYPEQNVKVVKVITTHKSPKKIANYIFHERDYVRFGEDNKGCL